MRQLIHTTNRTSNCVNHVKEQQITNSNNAPPNKLCDSRFSQILICFFIYTKTLYFAYSLRVRSDRQAAAGTVVSAKSVRFAKDKKFLFFTLEFCLTSLIRCWDVPIKLAAGWSVHERSLAGNQCAMASRQLDKLPPWQVISLTWLVVNMLRLEAHWISYWIV